MLLNLNEWIRVESVFELFDYYCLGYHLLDEARSSFEGEGKKKEEKKLTGVHRGEIKTWRRIIRVEGNNREKSRGCVVDPEATVAKIVRCKRSRATFGGEILQAGPMYPPPRDTTSPGVAGCTPFIALIWQRPSTTVICHSNGQKTKGHAVFNDWKPRHNAMHTTSRFSSSLIRSSTTRPSRSIVRVFPSISFSPSFLHSFFFLSSPLPPPPAPPRCPFIQVFSFIERAKTSPICLSSLPSSPPPFSLSSLPL